MILLIGVLIAIVVILSIHKIYLKIMEKKKKDQERKNYLEQIEQYKQQHLTDDAVSGNPPVDFIISQKEKEAKEKNIPIHKKLRIPEELDIEDVDVCVMLAGALDHAMEIVELGESLKNIDVKMDYWKGFLSISIKSRCQRGRELKYKKQDGASRNKLNSINKIVLKYHGIMELTDSHNCFELYIRMYG